MGSVVAPRARDETRNHQIVEGQRKGQQPSGQQSRRENGDRNIKQHPKRPAAQIHRRFFQGFIQSREPGLYHHGDIRHGKRDVRDGHRCDASLPRPADEISQRYKQQ